MWISNYTTIQIKQTPLDILNLLNISTTLNPQYMCPNDSEVPFEYYFATGALEIQDSFYFTLGKILLTSCLQHVLKWKSPISFSDSKRQS